MIEACVQLSGHHGCTLESGGAPREAAQGPPGLPSPCQPSRCPTQALARFQTGQKALRADRWAGERLFISTTDSCAPTAPAPSCASPLVPAGPRRPPPLRKASGFQTSQDHLTFGQKCDHGASDTTSPSTSAGMNLPASVMPHNCGARNQPSPGLHAHLPLSSLRAPPALSWSSAMHSQPPPQLAHSLNTTSDYTTTTTSPGCPIYRVTLQKQPKSETLPWSWSPSPDSAPPSNSCPRCSPWPFLHA